MMRIWLTQKITASTTKADTYAPRAAQKHVPACRVRVSFCPKQKPVVSRRRVFVGHTLFRSVGTGRDGFGTWIRTTIKGFRVPRPAIRRSRSDGDGARRISSSIECVKSLLDKMNPREQIPEFWVSVRRGGVAAWRQP